MPRNSFLHAAAHAKAQQTNATHLDDLSGVRMLLIEEAPCQLPQNGRGSLVNTPNLAMSLVMDAARAVAASSSVCCRGCQNPSDVELKDDVNKDHSVANKAAAGANSCRCCKVALLMPGETKKSRKRRNQSNNYERYASHVVGAARKIRFPLNFKPENNSSHIESLRDTSTCNGDSAHWEEHILNQIYVKYVHSLPDLIRYLAYAPSLPAHLQPLDGIFVIGLGDLLSRDNQTSGIMEMTHALSILSDTGKELEVNRRKVMKADTTESESITVIATLSQQTYQSLPKRIIVHCYQWIDYIASIAPFKSPDLASSSYDDQNDSSLCELAVTTLNQFDTSMYEQEKKTSASSLFRVIHSVNNHYEPIQEIVWNI